MNKCCSMCKQTKPDTAFYRYNTGKNAGYLQSRCIECQSETGRAWREAHPHYVTHWSHENGKCLPMEESKDCALYLGVVIAERALSKFFDHIERMPIGNPGFDFYCGKGFRIDVKSACLQKLPSGRRTWTFDIRRNVTADYFLLIAFDDRKNLNPMHVWLIPGDVINTKCGIGMTNSDKSLCKWAKYERPLDKVTGCCMEMRQ